MNKNVACQKIQKLWNTYLENGKNKLLKEILENPWKHTIHTCDIFDHYYPVLLEYWSLNIKGIR